MAAGAESPRLTADSKIDPNKSSPDASPPTDSAPSATTTARVAESLPKFTPKISAPEPKPGEPAPAAPLASQVPDSPRNSIIRLPQYDVREDKLPRFRERELLTPEGRAEIALRRHPGLRFGPLAFLNVRRGLQMLAEEDELDRRREMAELISFQEAIERELPQDPETGARTERVKAAAE